jgi:hypothetical protein
MIGWPKAKRTNNWCGPESSICVRMSAEWVDGAQNDEWSILWSLGSPKLFPFRFLARSSRFDFSSEFYRVTKHHSSIYSNPILTDFPITS